MPSADSEFSADLWKQELSGSYSSVEDLRTHGLITPTESARLSLIGERFKVRITPYYSSLIENSPHCPIRKQAVPALEESDPVLPEWISRHSQDIYGRSTPWHSDAIGDLAKLAAPRLTHRYSNRAILHLSSHCAVFCRFCFRKDHLNQKEEDLYQGQLDSAFSYLRSHPEIRELILTGGDPLSLTDTALRKTLERVSLIPQIRTVRIHSRMTVTLPYRITQGLTELLGAHWPFQVVLVSHFNHPKELTAVARRALAALRRSRVLLLNQCVLLKGVNNSVECLAELFQTLYEESVLPFYLHHPDWTPGTFHFRLSLEKGRTLVNDLKGLVSGPALPDYTLDLPQGFGKVSVLNSNHRTIARLPTFESDQGPIAGTIYEFQTPHTREDAETQVRYLDLSSI